MDITDSPPPSPSATPLTVRIGRRDLVLLAGLPGAGKSVLLRQLRSHTQVRVLDSDQVRDPLRAALPAWAPYRIYRPVVHVVHHARIAWYAVTEPGPVFVHEPATRPATRAWLAALSRCTGRRPRLLWLDVDPEQARAGQRARGRVLSAESFRRHASRAEQVRRRLLEGRGLPGWPDTVIVRRDEVAGGLRLAADGASAT